MTTVLVTGASAGFGLAIAEHFVRDGARVIVCARRLDRLEAFASTQPERILPLQLDVTDRAGVEAAIAGLPADFREIDVLVNNAGLALGVTPAQTSSLDDWERMIATNCAGLVAVTRAVLPGMVARRRGTIVNIGSMAGETPYPGGNVYGASKAFVKHFNLNLNADLIGTGVRATCLEPGLVGGTEFSNVRLGDDAKAAAVYAGVEALSADDIAETVVWLASRPPHVVIHTLTMTPNAQSYSPMTLKRG